MRESHPTRTVPRMPSDLTMKSLWTDLRIALTFLTRLPAGRVEAFRPEDLARALRVAPPVGCLVGLVGGGAYWLAALIGLPPLAAGLIAVAATVLITGALHEDGLGDLADGFAGGKDRESKLAIMRDSRVGTYGALALIFSVGLRAAALAAIAAPTGGQAAATLAALIAAHAVSRALLPAVMALMAPARGDGLAARAGAPRGRHALSGLALGAAIAALVAGPAAGLTLFAAAAVAGAMIACLAQGQIRGYTGDVLGTVQQAGEVAALIAMAALA